MKKCLLILTDFMLYFFPASNHGNVSDVATPQALSSIKGDLPTLLEKLIAHYDTN